MEEFYRYMFTGEGLEAAVEHLLTGTANTGQWVDVMTEPRWVHLGPVSREFAEWLARYCRAKFLGVAYDEPCPARWPEKP